jgi:hypothetical protein
MANLGWQFKIILIMIFVTCAVLPGHYIQSYELKLDAGIKKLWENAQFYDQELCIMK